MYLWLPIKQLCDRLWSMPLLYGRLLHPRPALTNCQVMQNAALRTATGCTQDTNIQHLHDETLTLPIHHTDDSPSRLLKEKLIEVISEAGLQQMQREPYSHSPYIGAQSTELVSLYIGYWTLNNYYYYYYTRAPTAPRLTIQTENTTSITSPTQTHNILQHSKAKKTHYF